MTRSPQLPRRASLTASVVKAFALGLLMVALVSGFTSRSPVAVEEPTGAERGADVLSRAMSEHRCTATGFGDAASPRSALIRRDGQLRHVTFDQAWSVFTGAQPGELVAVCLSEASVGERPVAAGA